MKELDLGKIFDEEEEYHVPDTNSLFSADSEDNSDEDRVARLLSGLHDTSYFRRNQTSDKISIHHRKQLIQSSKYIKCNHSITALRTKGGGYTGRSTWRGKKNNRFVEPKTLQEAMELGLSLVECDTSYDTIILDVNKKVIAVVSSSRQDATYRESVVEASTLMQDIEQMIQFDKSEESHKRGSSFVPINGGLSFGNGHKAPTLLKPKPTYAKALDRLKKSEAFQQIANHQDVVYSTWHPNGYHFYKRELGRLWKEQPHLNQPIFPFSIFPSFAVNVGRNVSTSKHIDAQNFPFGWCLITALGQFDHTKGGHLILWDLGIILEFPAGACIGIPSALVAHSNIPVSANEVRTSFVQYCGGEIFRYIENGFRTDKKLESMYTAIYKQLTKERQRRGGLDLGYELFLTFDELMADL